ncbi:MAG TPA: DNA translocase FtsK 4TM domain-containing protein, partial [Planctomycetota bacterium]|nr:DNA translocase FtsK 4TM domain-containing protein [Planctomycetota bacterium]
MATPSTIARTERAPDGLSARVREATALLLLGASVFLVAALATYRVEYRPGEAHVNVCGFVGHRLADALVVGLGAAAFLPLAFGAMWSLVLFLRGRIE